MHFGVRFAFDSGTSPSFWRDSTRSLAVEEGFVGFERVLVRFTGFHVGFEMIAAYNMGFVSPISFSYKDPLFGFIFLKL